MVEVKRKSVSFWKQMGGGKKVKVKFYVRNPETKPEKANNDKDDKRESTKLYTSTKKRLDKFRKYPDNPRAESYDTIINMLIDEAEKARATLLGMGAVTSQ